MNPKPEQPDLDELQDSIAAKLETHFEDYKYPGPKGGAMASQLVAGEIVTEVELWKNKQILLALGNIEMPSTGKPEKEQMEYYFLGMTVTDIVDYVLKDYRPIDAVATAIAAERKKYE